MVDRHRVFPLSGQNPTFEVIMRALAIRPFFVRSTSTVVPGLLALWLLLPLAGMLRVMVVPDTDGPTTLILLEEEVHPAEVTWQALFTKHWTSPDGAVLLLELDDRSQLSPHGEVPHLPPWR
jgi:hypothetical protein